jgi:hypothetical protein
MLLSQSAPQPPVEIPLAVHLVLWPALIVWVWTLARRPARERRLPPAIEVMLVLATLLADSSVVLASVRWPGSESNSFVLALLWFALLLSLTVFIVLRTPRDDGDGGGSPEDVPEPPWWPDFERRFRDYVRTGPRPPSRGPRVPAGTRS